MRKEDNEEKERKDPTLPTDLRTVELATSHDAFIHEEPPSCSGNPSSTSMD